MTATAMVLCGGASRRFGADKTRQVLDDDTVLDHLLGSLPASWAVVAVGLEGPVVRDVAWTREQPSGGGPLAAMAAGLTRVTTDLVVVIAGDMPFAGAAAVRLVDALVHDESLDAVVSLDSTGRTNPLLAAYRSEALRSVLPAEPAGAPARLVLRSLAYDTLATIGDEALDVDTPQALEIARHRLEP